LLVQVWRLDPNGFFGYVNASVDNDLVGTGYDLIVIDIILPDLDDPVTAVKLFPLVWRIIVDHIALTVVIKKYRRINSVECQLYRIAPALARIFRFHNKISQSSRKCGSDHVKRVVVRIVCNARSVYTCADTRIVNIQLAGTVQHMTNLRPVYQVFRMKDGNAGKHRK